jgi:hypothetical protein
MRQGAWWVAVLLIVMTSNAVRGQDSTEIAFRPFMHKAARQGGMKLVLTGVYLGAEMEWFCMSGFNHSLFDYRVDWVSFRIRDRHRGKRVAVQEIHVQPVFVQQPTTIPGDSVGVFVYGLIPRVIGRNKELVIELRERNGDRNIRLVVRRMGRVRKCGDCWVKNDSEMH